MNKQIERAMNSLQGMEKARPSDLVFEKLSARISSGPEVDTRDSVKSWLSVAAAVLILVSANVFFIADYFDSASQESESSYQELVSDFNLYQQ